MTLQSSPSTQTQLWGHGNFRTFISHVEKEFAKNLKHELQKYEIASFVSADNIHGGERWREKIECALNEMDFLVALVTPSFHTSMWANQEVGYAYARNTPIISIKQGANPDGLIGKLQRIDCTDKNVEHVAVEVFRSLLHNNDSSPIMWKRLIDSFSQYPNNANALQIETALSQAVQFPVEQERRLVATINSTLSTFVSMDSFSKIAIRLGQLTGRMYILGNSGQGRVQMILNDPNTICGFTGQTCDLPGIYYSQCRPDISTLMEKGSNFPLCGIHNQHHPHPAYWFSY